MSYFGLTKMYIGKKLKFTFSLVEYIWHILETNVTLQKVGFKSYLHFKKSIWNQLVQWIF
jgi:hypothetical protein